MNASITYIYTATGQKLAQVVLDKGIRKQTDYVDEYIYQNDTLQFINHEEGRVVMTGVDPEYQYHLKDHLGNVCITFTTKEEVEAPTATLETANQASDQANFLRYNEARKVLHYLFDKTNDTLPTQVDGYAQRLNGSINERFGLACSLAVMLGDKINTEVFAKYIDIDTSNWSVALNTLLTQIAAGTTTGGTVIDGGNYTSSTTSFPFSEEALANTEDSEEAGPKAYLNWLVFDKNYVLLDGGYDRPNGEIFELKGQGKKGNLRLDSRSGKQPVNID